MTDWSQTHPGTPRLLEASRWRWRQPRPAPSGWKSDMWIGTDAQGREWLVKMRGRAAAVREHLFAALAEHLGMRCPHCAFISLEMVSEPMRARVSPDPFQLAFEFETEHATSYCGPECPVARLDQRLRDHRVDKIETLRFSGLPGALNFVRGLFLGLICGQREPPQLLWTIDHRLVLIDFETMWSRKPRNPIHSLWPRISASGGFLARHVCGLVANLSQRTMDRLAAVPEPFRDALDSGAALRTARSEARRFLLD